MRSLFKTKSHPSASDETYPDFEENVQEMNTADIVSLLKDWCDSVHEFKEIGDWIDSAIPKIVYMAKEIQKRGGME